MYPPGFQTWVNVEQLGAMLEGEHRPGHFRGVATVCLKLFRIVRPTVAYFGQKDAQQIAVLRRHDLRSRARTRAAGAPNRARFRRPRPLVPQRAPHRRRARTRARAAPALATRDRDRARALLAGLEVDYIAVAPFDPPVLAAAVRVGGTRLIDNVPLQEEI